METSKLIKLVIILFLAWLFVTYVPNALLHKWWFLLFVFADFYVVAHFMKKKSRADVFINTVLWGTVILAIASIVFNRLGF